MKNEIDQTVERIEQLPKMSETEINECLSEMFKQERLDDLKGNPVMCLTIVQSMADMRKDKHPTVAAAMDGLCAAYTQLKADLATAVGGLEHIAGNWECGHQGECRCLPDIAQDTLDKIGKE